MIPSHLGPQAYPGRRELGACRELASLLQRIALGDEAALVAFYSATCKQVHTLALRILRDHQKAEEATADVYLRVWRRAQDFDSARGDARVWLMTITRSRAIDRLRADLATEQWEQAAPAESWATAPSAAAPIDTESVRLALKSLPRNQRDALELAYFQGLSQSEIAARLGEPLGTIKTRTRLALRKLRSVLDEGELHS